MVKAMKIKNLLALSSAVGLAVCAASSHAVNGHYVGGIEGVKNAVVPPEGIYYRGYLVHYDIDSLKDDDGNSVPGSNTGSVTAFVSRLIWMTDKTFLGADYGMEVIIPVQRNSFDFRGVGLGDTQSGIGDVFIGPLILAWHGRQWDAVFAAGHWFSIGDFEPGEASIGKGFDTTMLTLGGAWHLNQDRTWSVSALSRYEIKGEQDDTGITPGDSWIVEWGISHQLDNGIDVGLVGYNGWQLEADSGMGSADAKQEAHAIGAEVGVGLPGLGAMLNGAVYTEYSNKNRPQGNIFRLQFTKAF
jgi:hypothetical protein